MTASKASTLAILAALSKFALADPEYCTFYSDDLCTDKSGHDAYDIGNNGIFQNGGPFLRCGAADEFSLISYPPGDSSGNNPNHCHVFVPGSTDSCYHLGDGGFTTGDGGYYRLSYDKVCPSGTDSKKRHVRENLGMETMIAKRDDNYLSFYADPACEQRTGGVGYSINNAGCFENQGTWASFGAGDGVSWHLTQWKSSGNQQCSGDTYTCQDASLFYGGDCIKLDDHGYNSGYGSYQIGKGGCP